MTPAPARPIDRAAAEEMWEAYAAAHPAATAGETCTADRFGDSLELGDALLAAVTHGPKRATSTLLADFAAAGEPLPVIGAHWVACDGHGTPQAILRTTELRIATFDRVDEDFAFDEGEDDRSLESWRREHHRYFTRTSAGRGARFTGSEELLLERFAVVWPPEIADGR